ncbi:MAG TPA: hypothetical protein VFN45_09305 [Myxococcaceae bacterium]|nr:hypothetical protein [Myxococcaceae bacterium]
MPSERSRPPVPSPTESSAEPVQERTYDEEQVAAILRRAARLEPPPDRSPGGLSLREVEAIARDAGIDVGLVRRAARELDDHPGGGLGAAIAGAPVRRTIERVVDGEVGAEDLERMAEEIREVLSSSAAGGWTLPRHISPVGRTLTVSGARGMSSVEVSVLPRKGQTVIRISTDRSQLAGGLFGGIVGGLGGGLGAQVGWMLPVLLHLPVEAGLAGAGAVVLGAYALARSIFGKSANSVDPKLAELAARLEDVARDAASRRSAPTDPS